MDWEELIKAGERSELVLQFEQAARYYIQAIETPGGHYHGARRMAALRLKTGDLLESIKHSQLTLRFNPDDYLAASSMIYAKQCLSESTPAEIFRSHLDWSQTFTSGLQQFPAYPIAPFAGRKRKVGFISPDFFHRHPILSFFQPILDHLDRSKFDLYLYSCCQYPDPTTAEILQKATHGRQFSPQTLPEASLQIWEDQLDLLVDLSGHSSNHTLMALAVKPCHRQVTYLGYPNTTGLSQVDFRLSDERSDPTGMTEQWHTEKLVRFPACAWCFQPPREEKTDFSPPFVRQGHVTFGCFNNLAKLSDEILLTWGRILAEVPKALLLIKAGAFVEGEGRERMAQRLSKLGLPIERVILQPSMPYHDHLQLYRQIDIALDTFPYHGTTTTCEALWMGVPVITQAGNTHISRVGLSLLAQVQLEELIATHEEEYVTKAVQLAHDLPRLQKYHLGLRERLKASMLLNPRLFLQDFEQLLMEMMS